MSLVAAGFSILLLHKNGEALICLVDPHDLLEKGRVVWTGPSAELAADAGVRRNYLGV